MTGFYRKLRQNLLSDNKLSKYLLYAIGEIVLVVIGILIALQVSNWNNARQLRQVEIKYLKELAINLQSDTEDIRFNIAFNEVRLRACQMVLQSLQEHETYSDSLDNYYGNLLYTTRSVVNMSAYETLKSRGLEIISNDSLRQVITKLYSFTYQNAIDFEIQDDHALQYSIFMPTVLKKIIMDPANNINEGLQRGRPMDFQALKTDDEFKNALVMNIDIRKYMLEFYRELEVESIACLRRVQEELKIL